MYGPPGDPKFHAEGFPGSSHLILPPDVLDVTVPGLQLRTWRHREPSNLLLETAFDF